MTADAWLERLSELLAVEDHFEGAQWAEGGLGLWLKMRDGQPLEGVGRLRRSPALMRHLEAWSGPELLVTLHGRAEAGGRPHLLLRGGSVLLVVGEGGAEVVSADTVEGWFRTVFGMEPPFEDRERALVCVGDNVWAGPGLRASALTGLPWGLFAGEGRYRIVAFSGYGTNSWACYFTDVRPGIALKLRLPFGGAYMDPVRCREGIERTIRAATELADEAERLGATVDCVSNMGETQVEVADGKGRWELVGRLWHPLVDALARLRA